MNIKLSVVLALIIVGIFPAASLYAWQTGKPGNVPEGPEFALERAIDYAIMNHEELKGLKVPASWKEENLTPEGLVGSNTIQYTGGGWTVTTKNAVVLRPTYSVEIEYEGEISFRWSGTVDQEGNIVENKFTVEN